MWMSKNRNYRLRHLVVFRACFVRLVRGNWGRRSFFGVGGGPVVIGTD